MLAAANHFKVLYGASDASFNCDRLAHTWVLFTGLISDLRLPDKNIQGSGPVDGFAPYLSFSHGKLQGIRAVSLMSNLLIKYHEKQIPVSILCDNQGVQKNVNLFLSTVFAVIGYQISISTLHNMHILSHLDKSFAG